MLCTTQTTHLQLQLCSYYTMVVEASLSSGAACIALLKLRKLRMKSENRSCFECPARRAIAPVAVGVPVAGRHCMQSLARFAWIPIEVPKGAAQQLGDIVLLLTAGVSTITKTMVSYQIPQIYLNVTFVIIQACTRIRFLRIYIYIYRCLCMYILILPSMPRSL